MRDEPNTQRVEVGNSVDISVQMKGCALSTLNEVEGLPTDIQK